MTMNDSNDKKYIFPNGRILTREQIFESKEMFHREQAKLPYEEKVEMVKDLQKIIKNMRLKK